MKQKLLFAIPILVIMAVIIVVLILTRDKEKDDQWLLADYGYPVSVEENGTGLRVTLDGSKTKDFEWIAEAVDEDIVTVSKQGEEKKGILTYEISPVIAGFSEAEFIRSGSAAGKDITVVSIVIPLLVHEEEGELKVSYAEEAYIKTLNEEGGTSLEYPYLLENREDGTASVTFPKGESDWVFMDPDGIVRTDSLIGTDGAPELQVILNPSDSGSGSSDDNDSSTEFSEGSTNAGASAENVLPEYPGKGYYLGPETGADGKTHLTWIKDETGTSETDYYDTQLEKYRGHSSTGEDGSGSTVLLAMSRSQNVTEFIDVKYDADGNVWITLGKEP